MDLKQDFLELDFRRIFLAIWRNIGVILLVGILCAGILFSYAYFFVTPQYRSSAKLYVNNTNGINNNNGFSSSQLSAAQELAQTYMVILKSRSVLEDVISVSGLSYTYDQLHGMVSASAVNNTEVFQVSVTCSDYDHAAVLANAIAQVLPEKIAAVVDGSSVRVVDYATVSKEKVSPNYATYMLIGALAGSVVAVLIAVAVDLLVNSINEEEYLAQVYEDIPLLAVIPDAVVYKSSSYYRGYYASPYKKTGGDA